METRSHTTGKENPTSEGEGVLGSRMEALEGRVEQSIAEMFEAIRLLKGGNMKAAEDQGNMAALAAKHPIQQGCQEEGRGRTNGGNPYSAGTRLDKLDFPRFDADRIKEWIFKVEQFFEIDRTPDDLKIGIASIHFVGVAVAWHQSVVQS